MSSYLARACMHILPCTRPILFGPTLLEHRQHFQKMRLGALSPLKFQADPRLRNTTWSAHLATLPHTRGTRKPDMNPHPFATCTVKYTRFQVSVCVCRRRKKRISSLIGQSCSPQPIGQPPTKNQRKKSRPTKVFLPFFPPTKRARALCCSTIRVHKSGHITPTT